jgi:hypothetical protein
MTSKPVKGVDNLFNKTYSKRHRSFLSHHEINLKKRALVEASNKIEDLCDELKVMRMDLRQVKFLKNQEFVKHVPKSTRLEKKAIKLIKENLTSQVSLTTRSHKLNISNLTCDFPMQENINPFRKTVLLLTRSDSEKLSQKPSMSSRIVEEEDEKQFHSVSLRDNFTSPISYQKLRKFVMKEIGPNKHFETILNQIYRKVVYYSNKNKFVGEQTLVNLIRDEKNEISKLDLNKLNSDSLGEESSYYEESTKNSITGNTNSLNTLRSFQTTTSFHSQAKNLFKSPKLNLKSNLEAIGEFKETESCHLETDNNKKVSLEEKENYYKMKINKLSSFKPKEFTSKTIEKNNNVNRIYNHKIQLNDSDNLPFINDISQTRNKITLSIENLVSSGKSTSKSQMIKEVKKVTSNLDESIQNNISIGQREKQIISLKHLQTKSKLEEKNLENIVIRKDDKNLSNQYIFNSDLQTLEVLEDNKKNKISKDTYNEMVEVYDDLIEENKDSNRNDNHNDIEKKSLNIQIGVKENIRSSLIERDVDKSRRKNKIETYQTKKGHKANNNNNKYITSPQK